MRYIFRDFELADKPLRLLRAGVPVEAPPRILGTLAYLLEKHGEVVTREELIEHVWAGRIVSDSAIAKRLEQVRKIIGDSGREQALI